MLSQLPIQGQLKAVSLTTVQYLQTVQIPSQEPLSL